MKQITKQFLRTAMFSLCAVLFTAGAAQAATYTVTTTVDNVAGSLRQAITDANASAGINDTINFNIPAGDAGCSSGTCTITLTGGLPQIVNAGTLTIDNSAGASKIIISGNNTYQLLYLQSGSNLTLTALTLSNGRSTSSGGAIDNSGGTLTINDSTLNGNTASSSGGAINNSGGTLTINDSTLNGNTASIGGAIFNGGALTITNSTLTGNMAGNGDGGAVFNNFGRMTTINNSTISGNTGPYSGGIGSNGALTISNSTIAFNTATIACGGGCPGGIYNNGTTTLNNTIVAKNTAASPSSGDVSLTGGAGSSYNLIGRNTELAGITNGTNGNQVGTAAAPIDPLLAALADNGGKTQTHLPQTGSPAIDKGNSTLTTDQRGFARPVDNASIANATGGNGADIGSVEAALAPTAAGLVIEGRVVTLDGRGLMNAMVILTDTTGATRSVRTTTSGYFRFDDIAAGQTIVLSVSSKRYQFAPQVYNIAEDLTEIVLQARQFASKQNRFADFRSNLKP